jgi:AraC-like DNA-binding protein
VETPVEVDAGHEIEAVERLFLRFGDKFPNRFPILLKQVTLHSPLQYLKVTRLHKAKQMLQNENQSVAQAAYAVGYQSSSQFSREFKKQFGFSPNQTEVNIEKE